MKQLRTGVTTGTCAAGAAKAAALLLVTGEEVSQVEVKLPDDSLVTLPVVSSSRLGATSAEAAVRKRAGDDPDVTDGAEVIARVALRGSGGVTFRGGEGVGVVTRPGLQVPPGEPAINPVPRSMIRGAVAEVTTAGVEVTLAIPGGEKLAQRTFNPRLGVVGGLSILGTSGVVRPFSTAAVRDALSCAVQVARAGGASGVALVPGRIGERAARRHFRLGRVDVVEVSNEWGHVLAETAAAGFDRVLVVGHPGKLAKFLSGWWDTHSSRSGSAVPIVSALVEELLRRPAPRSPTVEGLFIALSPPDRASLAETLAARIRDAIAQRCAASISVGLVTMAGELLAAVGELSPWR